MDTSRTPASRAATASRRAALFLATLNAVGAAGGAVALVTGAIDLGAANARLPFHSPVLGGIALLVVVALPQSVLAWSAHRDDPRTPALGVACGVLLVGWILVEVVVLQAVAGLHWIYLAIGIVQVALGWSQVRRPDHHRSSPVGDSSGAIGVWLHWLPLGAGGWLVRLNGRLYEALRARIEHREPLDLYHTALEVRVPEGRFVIENSWPVPRGDPRDRGVVVVGPVGTRWAAPLRLCRYEVRRWRDGVIGDVDLAVACSQVVDDDPDLARRILALVEDLPTPTWGRDELATGEMWNSNSVIAWLLAASGLPTDGITPPPGGRAPGWQAGLVTAADELDALSTPVLD